MIGDFHARVLAGGRVEVVRLRPCSACGRVFDPRLDHDGELKRGGEPRRYCSPRCRARVARSMARVREAAHVLDLCACAGQTALPGLADVA